MIMSSCNLKNETDNMSKKDVVLAILYMHQISGTIANV